MNWQSLDQFVAMGGYGLYVWGSYLVTALCIAAEVALVMKRNRNARRDVRAAAQAATRRT